MITLRLLQQISGDRAVEGNLSCAPIINHDLGIFPCKRSYVCGKRNNGHCFLVILGDCSILFLSSIILYLFCVFFFSEESIHISLNFLLDVLAVVSKDSHTYSIPSLLMDSAVYQLDQVKRCLLKQSEVNFYWFLFFVSFCLFGWFQIHWQQKWSIVLSCLKTT